MWTSYDGRGGGMAGIMTLSWEAVRVATGLSSMGVDVDSSRDSNVGVRVRTVEPGPRLGWSGAGCGQAGSPAAVLRMAPAWRAIAPGAAVHLAERRRGQRDEQPGMIGDQGRGLLAAA